MKQQEIIHNWLVENKNFVLFRYPKSTFFTVLQVPEIVRYDSLQQLKQLSAGFVFSPFSVGKQSILIFPAGQEVQWSLSDFKSREEIHSDKKQFDCQPDSTYIQAFHSFQEALQEGNYQKLVLARPKTVAANVDVFSLFLDACCYCPDAMVYLLNSESEGTWLGATPEILTEGTTTQMHTVALAGTMVCNENDTPKLSDWSVKNRKEQSIVADYLRDCLRMTADLKDEWGPYSCRAAHLSHLKTDFYFRLDSDKLPELLSVIHPTPAVCGLPKNNALQFIQRTEAEERGYYSGFLGWYEPGNTTRLYVNLRCMNWIDKQTIRLMAGGGILSSSELEKEWLETEEKMQTLLRLPAFQHFK